MFFRSIAWTATIMSVVLAVHLGASAAPQPIRLVDQSGHAFTFESLGGRPLVLTFVAAHCSGACPIVEAQVERCVRLIGKRPLAVRFLTVTLDPVRDRALDMRRLAGEFDAHPNRWIFATGPQGDVRRLMRRFHVAAKRDARGYASAHSSFVFILDRTMNVRQILIPSDDLGARLFEQSTAG